MLSSKQVAIQNNIRVSKTAKRTTLGKSHEIPSAPVNSSAKLRSSQTDDQID